MNGGAVLHLVTCLTVGGSERQLLEVVRRLGPGRARVGFFRPGAGELLGPLRDLGIEPVQFPLGPSLLHPRSALAVARIARYCARAQIALVHAHDLYSNAVAIAAARLAAIPVIASRRDLGDW